MKVLSGAICAILAVSQVVAFLEIVDDNSFSPPYDNYDAAGKRVVPQWEYGGSAFVNSNFIRLTPDRAVRALTFGTDGHNLSLEQAWLVVEPQANHGGQVLADFALPGQRTRQNIVR